MIKGNAYTLTIAVLGAIKLVTESFGYKLFQDGQLDAIANGVSAFLAVGGIVLNHFKGVAPVSVEPVAPTPVTPEPPK